MNIKLETALSPSLIDQIDLAGKVAVVIDVLRATSCMVAAFMNRADHLIPFLEIEACRQKKSEGYWIAGERGGEKIPGFDLGNSPLEYMEERYSGGKFAITTTNGTRALQACSKASKVLIGSFANLSAVTGVCKESGFPIALICSGWKDRVNIEDTLFAGAVADGLELAEVQMDDASILARELFRNNQRDLKAIGMHGSHVRRLKGLDQTRDFDFCFGMDQTHQVPEYLQGVIRCN